MSVVRGSVGPASSASLSSVRRRVVMAVVLFLAVALAVCLWGGYTQGWAWTGVGDQETLWHWMNLLAVPIAFATLPLVLRSHARMRTERKVLLSVLLIAFVAFVIAGYAVPLEWTGFTGNTLWDWLTLLLLPAAIISVRFLREEQQLGPPHYAVGGVLVVAFLVVVYYGYAAPWDWTGFTGNTLLDWLQLLIVPIVFPTLVVPAVAAWFTATRERREAEAAREG